MKELFDKLNIKPKNAKLYEMAFSHSSYANENNLDYNYERLEFLGDAVVDLVVADYFYNNREEKEGKMTKERASYVCENALYRYSIDNGLVDYIKVGHGEEVDSNGSIKKAIVADVFEAFIAAIYLDLGYDKAKEVALSIIVPYVEDNSIQFFSDYKSALQEYVQTEQRNLIYELISETGPAHNKIFTMEVKIDDIVYGRGVASTKKEAEQEAAHDALNKLAK